MISDQLETLLKAISVAQEAGVNLRISQTPVGLKISLLGLWLCEEHEMFYDKDNGCHDCSESK